MSDLHSNDNAAPGHVEPDGQAADNDRVVFGGAARRWVSGLVFLALATVTFIAGEDDRWISIPAAIIAAVALIDFLWTSQHRRRSE